MIGVYSAMFGGYDAPKPTIYNGILFTDQKLKNIDGWHIKRVDLPHKSLAYSSRYYFINSYIVMPDNEYTIMHGANATLKKDPKRLVELLPPDIDIACCLHHHRTNVYDEAEAVIAYKKDKKSIVNNQMRHYKKEGFKGNNLSATIVLIRRNTPSLKKFEYSWWNEVKNGSVRDQLSFDYCLWKTGTPVHHIDGIWTDYINLAKHNNGKNYNDQKSNL